MRIYFKVNILRNPVEAQNSPDIVKILVTIHSVVALKIDLGGCHVAYTINIWVPRSSTIGCHMGMV